MFIILVVALKCAASAWALHVGFTHVSDDDYARVTIAQSFASSPHLDPSGTSWLPFPFWLNGSVMAAFGRGLGVARAVAIVSAILGALLVQWRLVRAGVARWAAFVGVALAMSTPWSTWLGVATVPEALCASLIVAGALCLSNEGDGAEAASRSGRLVGACALLLASLSRYEAWPVAGIFAFVCVASALRDKRPGRRLDLVSALIALAGPAAWLAWNAHAHGDAMHFLARVAAYRVRVTDARTRATLDLYPDAFARAAPLTLVLAAVAIPGLFFDRVLARRWRWPIVSMIALFAFLALGDLKNGAPTHHPERALLSIFWLASVFGVDGARSLVLRFVWARPKREAWLVGAVAFVTASWALAWPSRIADHPARSEAESRTAQMSRGAELRVRAVAHLTVTPCTYEHFALIAAFEAPERVTVLASAAAEASRACPAVEER